MSASRYEIEMLAVVLFKSDIAQRASTWWAYRRRDVYRNRATKLLAESLPIDDDLTETQQQ